MATGKKIKATPTRTGADGTGYFRGSDGRFYYGNKKNGYLTETIQSQEARAAEEAAPEPRPSYSYTPAPPVKKPSFIVSLVLSIIATYWILAFFAVLIAIAALFVGTLYSWPFILSMLFGDIAHGIVNAGRLLLGAGIFALLGYFVFCSYTVLSKRILQLRRFLIVGGIIVAVIAVVCSGGRAEDFFLLLLMSVSLLALPTLLLCFFEHLVTKEQRGDQRWFITRASKLIARYFIKKSTGMVVFGAIIVFLGVIGIFVDPSSATGWFMSFNIIAMGALLAGMGIIDKVR